MVSYQAWVSVAFETVEQQGAEFENISDGANALNVFAEVWNDRKAELSRATIAEARDIARAELQA